MKYLHILEYSPLSRIPVKESYEYGYTIADKIFRASIVESNDAKQIKESFDPYYNNSKIEETIIPLQDVVIVDDLDIQDKNQKLAYVFECPVCLNTIVSTDHDCNYCPHCENDAYSFELVAIISQELLEDMAVENTDETTYIVIEDGNIIFKSMAGEE